tara:strand:+ start:136 stop:432 length:297 start_codon:yes stop_codon:yes gene_type:complete
MKFNLYKIGYAIFSLLAGLTVGVLLAAFIGISSFINSLIGFPVQIYKQCVVQHTARRMQKVFGIRKNNQFADAKQSSEESIWDKHIQRMQEKKNNINN